MFQTKLLSEYQEAFLLHVLLMTHRITFNKQYEEIPCNREVSHERQEEIRQIECLFAKMSYLSIMLKFQHYLII